MITILDIAHYPVFYIKPVSGIGLCDHLEVEPTQLGPMHNIQQ
jgi:hypothetical protein